jgi:ABC-type branched-subunit amino acid transport system substrate-binding protein
VTQVPPQTCTQCKRFMYPGQPFCPNCGAVAQAAYPPTIAASSSSNTPAGSGPYSNPQSLSHPPFNPGGQQFTPSYPQTNPGGQQFTPSYPQRTSGYPSSASAPPPPPPSHDPYSMPPLSYPYSMPLPSDPYVFPPSQTYPQQQSGTNPTTPVFAKKRGRNWLATGALLLGAAVLIIGGTVFITRRSQGASSTSGTQPISVRTIGNEVIGISDGSTAFDVNRKDGSLKQQAADKLKQGDTGGALSLYSQAIATESNDGEALIYQEDLRIASTPHITFVVGAMPSGDSSLVGVSRDILQGAYLAQKECNDSNKLPGVKVRLLIASSGGDPKNVTLVTQQIVQLAKSDPTFVGVMGWPHSNLAFAAVQVLGQAQIPTVSSAASADDLTGTSPYFFRVVPPNKAQGIAGANYAQSQGAKNVAVFVDPTNLYSQSLGNDFKQQFVAIGGKVIMENYTVGKSETLQPALTDALKQVPDLVYFSGYSSDVSTLLKDLVAAGTPDTLKVVGGDALYELSGYNGNSPAERSRLRFTTFSYPDEWDVAGLGGKKPVFFTDYPATFSGGQKGYGLDRPTNDAMLSYDAMSVLLNAAAATGKTTIKMADLRQALTKTVFQGVSGYIQFGPDGDPIKKAFVVLKISPEGYTQMEKLIGNLTSSGK